MEILFWLIVVLILYIYAGYPMLLMTFSYGKRLFTPDGNYLPSVTLIIAAHNEEQVIRDKIENTILQEYPGDKLQIIVASDASTDRTNEIVKKYSNRGIELYDQKEHKGKSTALNQAVKNMAKGEIIVFNDATTLLEKDSVRKIVSYFSDNKTGAVAGKLIFKKLCNTKITQNHGLYWRYEEFLRESESKAGCLPFVSGAFYAIKKDLYTPVIEDLPDDSVSPLGVYRQGYAVIYANDALAHEEGAADTGSEFRIKVRGVIRELCSIFHFKELLNPFKYPLISLVLISHRLLRWSVSIFLIALFLTNLNLLEYPLYSTFFWIQVSFYLIAVFGLFLKRNLPVLSIPFYFSLVNTAALWGIIKFLTGQKQSTWQSVR